MSHELEKLKITMLTYCTDLELERIEKEHPDDIVIWIDSYFISHWKTLQINRFGFAAHIDIAEDLNVRNGLPWMLANVMNFSGHRGTYTNF